jgi:hypothetical protein
MARKTKEMRLQRIIFFRNTVRVWWAGSEKMAQGFMNYWAGEHEGEL